MFDTKLKILMNAIKIRIKNGELLDDILKTYPKLTSEDTGLIKSELETV